MFQDWSEWSSMVAVVVRVLRTASFSFAPNLVVFLFSRSRATPEQIGIYCRTRVESLGPEQGRGSDRVDD